MGGTQVRSSKLREIDLEEEEKHDEIDEQDEKKEKLIEASIEENKKTSTFKRLLQYN